ncbi:MAG TPA: hypothetical protein VNE38_05700 [Ktedonobacteraceae bacterium]|nr:hypothetical protein [Ktedonobacteraceae bacterium]
MLSRCEWEPASQWLRNEALPPNASWLDQSEIWFSVLQRNHL